MNVREISQFESCVMFTKSPEETVRVLKSAQDNDKRPVLSSIGESGLAGNLHPRRDDSPSLRDQVPGFGTLRVTAECWWPSCAQVIAASRMPVGIVAHAFRSWFL